MISELFNDEEMIIVEIQADDKTVVVDVDTIHLIGIEVDEVKARPETNIIFASNNVPVTLMYYNRDEAYEVFEILKKYMIMEN